MDDSYINVSFNGDESMKRFGSPPNLSGKVFERVTFRGIDFRKIIINGTSFKKVEFNRCNLDKVNFGSAERHNLSFPFCIGEWLA